MSIIQQTGAIGADIKSDGTNNALVMVQETDFLIQRMEYDSNGFIIYVGLALPGSADTDLVWQIKQLTNNALGQVIAVNFADSNINFDNSWTLRGGYSYG